MRGPGTGKASGRLCNRGGAGIALQIDRQRTLEMGGMTMARESDDGRPRAGRWRLGPGRVGSETGRQQVMRGAQRWTV